MDNVKTFWTWNWTSGGYNSCSIQAAPTLEKAIAFATKMGIPSFPGHVTLHPNPKTFRQVTTREMVEIDRSWASAFD